MVVDPDGKSFHMAFDDVTAGKAAAGEFVMPPDEGQEGSAADSAATRGAGSACTSQDSSAMPEPGSVDLGSRGASSLVQHVNCDIGHTVLSVADVSDFVEPYAAGSDAGPGWAHSQPNPAELAQV